MAAAAAGGGLEVLATIELSPQSRIELVTGNLTKLTTPTDFICVSAFRGGSKGKVTVDVQGDGTQTLRTDKGEEISAWRKTHQRTRR